VLVSPATFFAWVPQAEPPTQPRPTGKDIGLGFPVCNVSRTHGDFNGDGQVDTAFVATKLSDTRPCDPFDSFNVIAIDLDGDLLADVDYGPLEPRVCETGCAAFDATDLDGNGADELIVTSYFSIMGYRFFAMPANAAGEPRIEPILVADPGHRPAGIKAGEPLLIDAGGDEGYSSRIWCEGDSASPELVWGWSDYVIETQQPKEVHVTRIALEPDGLFHVVGTNDFSVPNDQPTGFEDRTAPACGVDWYFGA
jgi:hypothetical protein